MDEEGELDNEGEDSDFENGDMRSVTSSTAAERGSPMSMDP